MLFFFFLSTNTQNHDPRVQVVEHSLFLFVFLRVVTSYVRVRFMMGVFLFLNWVSDGICVQYSINSLYTE